MRSTVRTVRDESESPGFRSVLASESRSRSRDDHPAETVPEEGSA